MVTIPYEVGMLGNGRNVHILDAQRQHALCGLTGDWWIVYGFSPRRLCPYCEREQQDERQLSLTSGAGPNT